MSSLLIEQIALRVYELLTNKPPVDTVAVADVTLSGLQTINGVAGAEGIAVLLTAQTNAAQNGPWVMSSGGWARRSDFDTAADIILGSWWRVTQGTHAGERWYMSAPTGDIIVNSTALTIVIDGGSGGDITAVTAGLGLAGGGTSGGVTLDIGANIDGSIQVNANDIQVGVLATDAQHGTRGGGAIHAAATGAVAGFMSAADKTKLDAATSAATGATLALRDASGGAAFDDLTAVSLDVASSAMTVSSSRHLFAPAQSASGAGQASTLRAQKGQAGAVGGSLTIGGGDGGTPGTNLAGETIIQLGAVVGTDSAMLRVKADTNTCLTINAYGGTGCFLNTAYFGVISASGALIRGVGTTTLEAGAGTAGVVCTSTGFLQFLNDSRELRRASHTHVANDVFETMGTNGTIAITDNKAWVIEATIMGKSTTSYAGFILTGTVYRHSGGSATISGTAVKQLDNGVAGVIDVQLAVSGNNALVQVKGSTGATWSANIVLSKL